MRLVERLRKLPTEALTWMVALIALSMYYPSADHVSLCPFYQLGIDFCPGCGLGRSISHFLHGEITPSLKTHPLGIFAVIVLSLRIIKLSKLYFLAHGKNY